MWFCLSLSPFPPLSKKEGNNWRTICEGTDTRQDEKRMRSVSGPDKFIRDAIPYSAVFELARWRASSPSNRFRRSSCLCRSTLSEPVRSLSFHSSFIPFLTLPFSFPGGLNRAPACTGEGQLPDSCKPTRYHTSQKPWPCSQWHK